MSGGEGRFSHSVDLGRQPQQEVKYKNVEVEANKDPWEMRRQELAARGDIFDSTGTITEKGEEILRNAGWGDNHMGFMERLQQNYARKVESVPGKSSTPEVGGMSANTRPQIFADAQRRASEALKNRTKEQGALRIEQAQRDAASAARLAGIRAYDAAIDAGWSTETALQAKRDAMLKAGEVKNRKAA